MKRGIFLCVFSLLSFVLRAQGIAISHYLPGDYLSDNRHRVDIYNPFPQTVFIGGWILATRDYVVRFPVGTRIARESALHIQKIASGNPGEELSLSKVPDFLIKIRNRDYEGNYVVLFNTKMEIVDAFYFSPLPRVPFLPHSDTLITFRNEKIPYRLPSELDKKWGHVSVPEDPAIAFIHQQNKWTITSANTSFSAPTEFANLSLRYEEGVISIKWATRFEQGCGPFIIERSEDQQNFAEIDRIPSKGDSKSLQQYSDAIAEARQDKTFYFRIRTTNMIGNQVVSKVEEITTEEGVSEFSLDAFMGMQAGARELNVRFTTRFSQKVKIRLLDENLREVQLLFRDYVYSDTPNLLKTNQLEENGWYWVLAETETRRFWKKIYVD